MTAPAPGITVSVCMMVYNQAPWIRQALDSVFMQQLDCSWELCVGEDDSTDGTREICRAYADRHPERMRLFLRSRRDVFHVNGRPTARYNFMETLKSARGRYIALLDGDDFWLSPHKLQRQVDCLEANPGVALCGHRVRCIDADGAPHPELALQPPPAALTTTHDLLERNYLATSSVLFRARLFGEFPPWYMQLPAGDWGLHLLNSLHGDIAYLDEELAAYRLHAGGMWMGAGEVERQRWSVAGLAVLGRNLPRRFRRRVAEVMQLRRAKIAELEGRPGTALVRRRLAARLAAPGTAGLRYWLDHLRLPVAAIRDRAGPA